MYPTRIEDNDKSILFFHDPARFNFLRELETTHPFKQGLPDIAFFEEGGAKVVAVESAYRNDAGESVYRIWISESYDEYVAPPQAPPEAVFPDIRPGRPSRMCRDDPGGWDYRYGSLLLRADQLPMHQ